MADINERIRRSDAERPSLTAGLDEESPAQTEQESALLDLAELLFFAYRDFTSEPDKILEQYGFGRAHHRVLHFVNRHPGMRVADLLEILKITKQSLGRVLKQLVDEGFVAQEAGKTDRRERLLYPTARGQVLAERLAAPQLERIARALESSDGEAQTCIEEFLRHMIGDQDRAHVSELLKAATSPRDGRPPQA